MLGIAVAATGASVTFVTAVLVSLAAGPSTDDAIAYSLVAALGYVVAVSVAFRPRPDFFAYGHEFCRASEVGGKISRAPGRCTVD